MFLYSRTLLFSALLLFTSTVTQASPVLPDAGVLGDVLFNFSPPDRKSTSHFGTISLSDSRFGFVSFTSSGNPSPSLTASANIGPNATIPSIFGSGSGLLNYAFEILGPTGSVPVRIDVSGFASAVASPGASFDVVSLWELLDSPGSTTVLAGDEIRSGQGTGSFNRSFGHTVDIALAANHTFGVFMLVQAAAAATDVGSHGAADAFMDPIFSFGPGVDLTLYSFAFSPGIGNERAVPGTVREPGTLGTLSLLLVVALLSGRGSRTGNFELKTLFGRRALPCHGTSPSARSLNNSSRSA